MISCFSKNSVGLVNCINPTVSKKSNMLMVRLAGSSAQLDYPCHRSISLLNLLARCSIHGFSVISLSQSAIVGTRPRSSMQCCSPM